MFPAKRLASISDLIKVFVSLLNLKMLIQHWGVLILLFTQHRARQEHDTGKAFITQTTIKMLTTLTTLFFKRA